MCGICGIINTNKGSVQEASVRSMMKAMKHRGPDDDGDFLKNNIVLGFVRLSILDLTHAGHQPMFSKDNRYVLVYNGEIYNYIELKQELEQLGHTFHTRTDTEMILAAYQQWGRDCLHRFNGMWAFVIYDTLSGEVYGARDRYGIKPLYYTFEDNKLIFASEIPALLKGLKNKPVPNHQAIFDYLVFSRTDQTEETFFSGIKKVQHGHAFQVKQGEFSIYRWYNLKNRLAQPFASAREFKSTLSASIGIRLRSDVPVGVSLSGGLDSSTIASLLLTDHNKSDLNTFSAVYGKGVRGDESDFIDEYSSQIQQMHYTHPTGATLYKDLYQFVRAHGEPIPSTHPYAQYKVMELAKEHVVVTLDGQGADEELAGYHYFYGFYFKDLLRQLRLLKLLQEVYFNLKKQRSTYGLQSFLYFMLPENLKTSMRIKEKGYLKKAFHEQYAGNNSIAGTLYNASSLNEALLNHFEYKLEHLLKWEDRNSMFFSLESRVPFLDHRIVEGLLEINGNQVIRKGMTKHILREATKGLLPEKIRMRKDKMGFVTPEDEWFRTKQFQTFIFDLLNSGTFKSRGIINPGQAKNLYQQHLNRKKNISKEIWKWMNLELWFREFID